MGLLDRHLARPKDHDHNSGVGKSSPTIVAAYPGAQRRVHLVLRYPNGAVDKTVDLTPILKTGHLYAPLLEDHALFVSMRVNEDGKALEFNGDFTISATTIEWLADQGSGK